MPCSHNWNQYDSVRKNILHSILKCLLAKTMNVNTKNKRCRTKAGHPQANYWSTHTVFYCHICTRFSYKQFAYMYLKIQLLTTLYLLNFQNLQRLSQWWYSNRGSERQWLWPTAGSGPPNISSHRPDWINWRLRERAGRPRARTQNQIGWLQSSHIKYQVFDIANRHR